MNNLDDLKNLKAKIAYTRDLMDSLWSQHGYTHKDVLTASIRLDVLMNQYQRLISQSQEEQLNMSYSDLISL